VAHIENKSQARGTHNEDFSFKADLPDGHVLAVGDFANTSFDEINEMAVNELGKILDDPNIVKANVPLLLTQVALQFNKRLLDFKKGYDQSFQCCVVFAAVQGSRLFYLPIGDCRITVRRGETLFLLNGSVWVDPAGNPLTPMITTQQEMERGVDEAPSQVLGVAPVELPLSQVMEFELKKDDMILLFSDGVDKVVSPANLLTLILSAPPDESLGELVARVLSEVDIKNGDDDRTILIAAGPHESEEEKAVASALEQATGVRQKLKEQFEELRLLRDGLQQKGTVEGYFDTIKRQLGTLPTIVYLDQLMTSNKDLSTRQYKALKQQLDNLQATLRSVVDASAQPPGTRRARGEDKDLSDDDKTSSPPQGAGAGQDNINDARTFAPAGANGSLFQDYNHSLPFHEGVIHITRGRIELIDESDVDVQGLNRKDGTPKHIYLVTTSNAPPGWLTVWYLYLKGKLNIHTNKLSAADLKNWVLTQPKDSLQSLNNSELINWRESHWQLRVRRRKAQLPNQHGQITKEENELVSQFQQRLGVATTEGGQINAWPQPNAARTLLGKMWAYLKPHLWWVATIISLLVFSYIIFLRPNTTTEQRPAVQTQETTDKAWGFYLGADGRTLFLTAGRVREPSDYRIKVGSEGEFMAKAASLRFESVDDVLRALRNSLRDMVLAPGEIQKPPAGQKFFRVEAEDMNDPCNLFLKRVNNTLPTGVHTDIVELEKLNPGLRCREIKAGDELLVYIERQGR